MPEGPETAIIGNFVRAQLTGKTVTGIVVMPDSQFAKRPSCATLANDLQLPQHVRGVAVHGKFSGIEFNTSVLAYTLGMTGIWEDRPTKHTRLILELYHGEKLYFNDIRKFGSMKVFRTHEDFEKRRAQLGIDFLKGEITIDWERLKPEDHVCQMLMAQNVVAGVGSYIKCEALYRAHISPRRLVGDLSHSELVTLYSAVREIMWESYRAGGCSFKNFRDPSGRLSWYSASLAVYRRRLDPVGREVETIKTPDGRTTYWVPEVQV